MMEERFEKYLNHLAMIKGYKSYTEWYDFICRDKEIPVVVAMQIESINREAFKLCLNDIQIQNYKGMGVEYVDRSISELKSAL